MRAARGGGLGLLTAPARQASARMGASLPRGIAWPEPLCLPARAKTAQTPQPARLTSPKRAVMGVDG
ncbi:hypothetical protein [Allofranklinella schreckenbergeri]|uniref:hypothetical protein n=1 Tax=Allofranklinella schreckenbergeri TaxID=1076744 RepID=UPI000F5E3734|nr:hypothetical protein [Allofranklinella schreckenbergeri]